MLSRQRYRRQQQRRRRNWQSGLFRQYPEQQQQVAVLHYEFESFSHEDAEKKPTDLTVMRPTAKRFLYGLNHLCPVIRSPPPRWNRLFLTASS